MTFSCFILVSIFLTYFVEDTKKPKCFLTGTNKDSTIGLIIELTIASIFQNCSFK
ncbi:hypothetical protein Hanom_Chr00s036662g01772661 [Helianthus anomalus]